jgi:hypothetical protein
MGPWIADAAMLENFAQEEARVVGALRRACEQERRVAIRALEGIVELVGCSNEEQPCPNHHFGIKTLARNALVVLRTPVESL